MRPEMANMGGEIYAGRERASVAKESGGVWAAAARSPPHTLNLHFLPSRTVLEVHLCS